ncbi:ABC transporter ATP-binding protein, partial [Neptuniibacter sp.]|uniref:ABC transporter ATP-binding protein n=1 Tax=Neptuniibacter sp. TaxID=1962643 RepID=UPI0026284238
TEVNSVIQRGIAAAESIFDLLDSDAESDLGRDDVERVQGHLQLQNLSFGYDDDKPILQNVDLDIAPGRTVALVGKSGSGKSTLVNLIPRFYEVTQGQMLLDGKSLNDYELSTLRGQIAIVTQNVVLFSGTIRDNIAYGAMQGCSEEELVAAAEAAHVMEFVSKLPDGLDTVVGENGIKLSGGQRQRIAIARAILKNAPLLILDEATSALDTESERHIQAALENVMEGRTTIVIAHRLSTIENADLIVVMDQGQIVEKGSHGQLLAHEGAYANLYNMQFNDNADNITPALTTAMQEQE